jgi:F-type H+-transporting ATPase subunit delta
VNVDPVTARWCESLFGLAKKHGRIDAIAADVQRIARELAGERGAIVFDMRVPLAERRARVEPLLGACDPLTANFVRLAFDKRRELVLRDIGAAFHARLLAEQGAVEGIVESAHALSEGDVAEIAVGLSTLFKKRLVLKNRVRPDLLAGVRVIADGRMVDVSAQGRLDDLRKRLLEVALPAVALNATR